jgi:haloacid dehalogenase superfamily, subfamily IA, variant 3 with third motif having DD or ED
MELTGIKNLVFDLGGVILTLDRDRAVARFLEVGLENAEELLDPYHQKGIFLQLENGELSRNEFYEAIRREAGKDITNEEIDWGWMGFIADCPDYKLKMLEDLREQGYKLYLLSNTNPIIMSWALSPDFSSQGKSLADYFDKLYLSFQIGCTKPDPVIFRAMIDDAGLIPEETLFIDDGAGNVRTGQEFGFKTYQPENGEDFRYLFSL